MIISMVSAVASDKSAEEERIMAKAIAEREAR